MTPNPTKDPLTELLTMTPETAMLQKPIILEKGPPGVGKTFNLLTFPQPIVGCYSDKNMLTVTEAQLRGVNAKFMPVNNWSDWADVFVPSAVNRTIDAATLAVDPIDMLATVMWREIQGTRDKLRIQDFGTGKDRMFNTLADLCSSASHIEGKRSYNIVCTSHISDVTDDSGSLVKTTCQLMGAFKDIVESLFDYVFLCDYELKTDIVSGKAVKSKRFYSHTIPPNRYHTTKAPGYFPAEMEGSYQGIQEALALNPERRSSKNTQQEEKTI